MHGICTARHSFRKVWAFWGRQKDVSLVIDMQRYQKNSLFGIIFFGGDQFFFLVLDSKNRLFLYIFAFMDRWFGIFRASALGSLEPPKPYGSCHLATRRRRNLTHTMIWRPGGAQTLRKLSFGDREAPKPYAHCDLETQRHPNLTEAVIWRPRTAQTLCSMYFAYRKPQKKKIDHK